MKAKEKDVLKSHSLAELRAELATSREKQFRLRFGHGITPLANPMELRNMRRHIARLETFIRQKEMPQAAPVVEAKPAAAAVTAPAKVAKAKAPKAAKAAKPAKAEKPAKAPKTAKAAKTTAKAATR